MTPEQIKLVQTSFKRIWLVRETTAQLFFQRLFELDPPIRHLFIGDVDELALKLIDMLQVLVNGLDNVNQIIPVLTYLGNRHISYGVKDKHYTTVGTALLWTIEQILEDSYTPEVSEAWGVTYNLMSQVMKGENTSN